MRNNNITKAKMAKNDEFYTQYDDIDKELSSYDISNFENKIILCPCDDWEWSNFTLYFLRNFEKLKLKKLVCTCYNKDGRGKFLFYDLQDAKFGLKTMGILYLRSTVNN